MFSILTLNLRFGLANDGSNNWVYRKEVFPSLLKKYRSDFMGFQEANNFQGDFLREILSPDYHFIGERKPAPPFWQNNLIFYKKEWKCSYYEHFFLSPTPTIPSRLPKSLWPRQCTLGVFENTDKKIICINTHFDFDDSVQVESAKIIMERLSHLPSDLPAILIGDFNAPPLSPCYEIFTKENYPDETELHYFKDTFTKPFPPTYHGFTGELNGEHIDWILYRGGITLKNAMVIDETFEKRYPSDHFPVRAEFKYKQ